MQFSVDKSSLDQAWMRKGLSSTNPNDAKPQVYGEQLGWCANSGTVHDLEAKLQQKQEGVIKRERALAYASSRQVAVNIEISALCDLQCSPRYVLP